MNKSFFDLYLERNSRKILERELVELSQAHFIKSQKLHLLQFNAMSCLLKSAESKFCSFGAAWVHPLMRLHLDAGQRILRIRAESRAKRSNSEQFWPNFRAESHAPARIDIMWLRTQSNKPSLVFWISFTVKIFAQIFGELRIHFDYFAAAWNFDIVFPFYKWTVDGSGGVSTGVKNGKGKVCYANRCVGTCNLVSAFSYRW